jgi:hypothetical protein
MLKQRKLEWWERYTLQGQATLLRRLFERRFGALPAWVERHFATASEENLIRWGRRILGEKLVALQAASCARRFTIRPYRLTRERLSHGAAADAVKEGARGQVGHIKPRAQGGRRRPHNRLVRIRVVLSTGLVGLGLGEASLP